MKITLIGAGAIGGTLADRLGAAGHDVLVTGMRGHEPAAGGVRATGVSVAPIDEAVQDRDVIVLAVPFTAQTALAAVLADVPGTTIIVDTSNYYPFMSGPVPAVDRGQIESAWSEEQLGRPVVKAWNAALAATQQTRALPAGTPGRLAIPVAGDAADARAAVMQLVDDTGFDPFDAGVIGDSWRQQPGTPAYCTELGLDDLGRALAAADRDTAPATRDRIIAELASRSEAPSLDEVVAMNRSAHPATEVR